MVASEGGSPVSELLGGAGIMAVWQVALVKQLRIMGSNPTGSQPHILVQGRRKAEEWGKAMDGKRVFRRYNYWLHAPHLYLKTK